jgi:CheY-specific phosphatase CheX
MFAEPCAKEDLPHSTEGYRAVALPFEGDLTGCMTLMVPLTMCRELAANVLGANPQDADVEEKALDALKETLNVVCGHVLTTLGDEDGIYDLGVPGETKAGPRQWRKQLESSRCLGFLVDDEFAALLCLELEGNSQ